MEVGEPHLEVNLPTIQVGGSDGDDDSGPSCGLAHTLTIVSSVLGALLAVAMVVAFMLWWKLRALKLQNRGAYSTLEERAEEVSEKPTLGSELVID